MKINAYVSKEDETYIEPVGKEYTPFICSAVVKMFLGEMPEAGTKLIVEAERRKPKDSNGWKRFRFCSSRSGYLEVFYVKEMLGGDMRQPLGKYDYFYTEAQRQIKMLFDGRCPKKFGIWVKISFDRKRC